MENNADGDEDHIDEAFENHIQNAVVWVGDGYFIDQSWVNLGESEPVKLKPDPERPLVLHTCLRHEEGSANASYSYAHDRHPFVALVHLLDTAEPGSDFFMSVPFLGDFDAIDQLCHYANPDYGGLQIYIILGPKEWNVETLRKFVGRSKTRQEAVNRLHMKRFGHDQHFSTATYSHSKVMVSSAGAMIGSYNLTGAARLRHTEHSVLLGPEPDSNIEGLRDEFRQMWGEINTEEIIISRTPSPSKNAPPDPRKVHNPYKRPKPKHECFKPLKFVPHHKHIALTKRNKTKRKRRVVEYKETS